MVLTIDKQHKIADLVDKFNESKAGGIEIKTRDKCTIKIDKHRIVVYAQCYDSSTWTYAHWKIYLTKPISGEVSIIQRNIEDWTTHMCLMVIKAEDITEMRYV